MAEVAGDAAHAAAAVGLFDLRYRDAEPCAARHVLECRVAVAALVACDSAHMAASANVVQFVCRS